MLDAAVAEAAGCSLDGGVNSAASMQVEAFCGAALYCFISGSLRGHKLQMVCPCSAYYQSRRHSHVALGRCWAICWS